MKAQAKKCPFGEVDAVGVEPDMHFHVACVRLSDGPCKRVPAFLSAPLALPSGKPVGDGFEFAEIERVGSRTDLEDDGIDADSGQRVEFPNHFGLLAFRIADSLNGRPVDIGDGSNPGTPEGYFVTASL